MRASELAALLHPRTPVWRPTQRRLQRAISPADLRESARRRLPRSVFEYVDGGAETETALRRNTLAFEDLELLPRVLRDVSDVDLSTTLLGRSCPLPVVLAPTGFSRLVHHTGERAVARAAATAGIPYCLSTMATTSIEQVAASAGGPLWFQLYVWRDRGLCRELMDRARAAGFQALVLTVDVPVSGSRERDQRNGLTVPPQIGMRALLDGARRPWWWWRFVTGDPIGFANIASDATEPQRLMQLVVEQFDATVTWQDIAWMIETWGGPFVVKGISHPRDAELAADAGAQAVVVSNHGGRQLDHAVPTISALPEVVDAVGDRVEVLLDSGVRRGTDIVKALALGARAVMVGRPYLYGLATAGERGVGHSIDLLRVELARAMALVGARSIAELEPQLVRRVR